jgi:hypothetical protein
VGTLTFFDSAYPLSSYPDANGFCFYIGGDTPHVWSVAEVAVLKSKYAYLLPIFVRSNPPGPGAGADVSAAVAQLQAIGAPKGCLVAWDMEMAADAAYILSVSVGMAAAGYPIIVYGSESDVLGNDNPDGLYWGADWTDVAHLAGPDEMTQYVSFSADDESEADSSLPFWATRGPAPKPAVTPAFPYPATGYLGVESSDPDCHSGYNASDRPHIETWQRQMADRGWTIGVDGDYGPQSQSTCEAFQQQKGLAVDGKVGPVTWKASWADPVT